MKRAFYIDSKNGYADMLMQYKVMHEQIGAVRFLPNHNESRGIIYDIRPEYGKGTIQVYNLLGNIMLLIFDFVFLDNIETVFDLTRDYFEIEYCLDGYVYIQEEKAGSTCFGPNCLSVSLSQDTRGTVKRCARQKYQGVSITADKSEISAYFGSAGIEIWDDTIEKLEKRLRSEYYLGRNAPPEIATVFLQIFNCRLPAKSRTLFYESKVMEALAKIVSFEVMKDSGYRLITLSSYELQRIKEIPQILMDRPHELPNLLSLSNHLVMNPKKLAKGFKMVYGDTIFSYHRKLSLERASIMLLDTDKSINEIAYDLGYSNPSNFCSAFKKQYRITPLKYRESSFLRKGK